MGFSGQNSLPQLHSEAVWVLCPHIPENEFRSVHSYIKLSGYHPCCNSSPQRRRWKTNQLPRLFHIHEKVSWKPITPSPFIHSKYPSPANALPHPGTVHEAGTPSYNTLLTTHGITPLYHTRSIITLHVTQAGSSCGFSVPYYTFNGYREVLNNYFDKKKAAYDGGKESESMDKYWAFKSSFSVDGLPGMKRAVEVAKLEGVKPLKKMVGREGEIVERRMRNRRGAGGWAGLKKRTEITGLELLGVVLLSFLIGVLGVVTLVRPETVRWVQDLGNIQH